MPAREWRLTTTEKPRRRQAGSVLVSGSELRPAPPVKPGPPGSFKALSRSLTLYLTVRVRPL